MPSTGHDGVFVRPAFRRATFWFGNHPLCVGGGKSRTTWPHVVARDSDVCSCCRRFFATHGRDRTLCCLDNRSITPATLAPGSNARCLGTDSCRCLARLYLNGPCKQRLQPSSLRLPTGTVSVLER